MRKPLFGFPQDRTSPLPLPFSNLTNLKASALPAGRLTPLRPPLSCFSVLRFRQLACLLLVALWIPATAHCDFEAIGLDEIFHCATDHHAPTSDAQPSDTCEVVESGWIKRAPSEIDLTVPAAVCVCLICACTSAPVSLRDVAPPALTEHTAAPPELGRTWQFVSRAALSPRAPSFAS